MNEKLCQVCSENFPCERCFSTAQSSLLTPDFPVLVSLSGSQLRIYDLMETKTVSSSSLPRCFSLGTMFCMVEPTKLLWIGGWDPDSNEVYWLDLDSNQISAAAVMPLALGYPGVIRIGKWVYTFGGHSQRKLCESAKYSLENNSWTVLSPMSIPKFAFSPCLFQSDVFLLELCEYQGAEKFHTQTETYTSLSVALPSVLTSSFNVLVGREMLFLTSERKVWKWNVETGVVAAGKFACETVQPHLVSSCPPVYRGNCVYFVEYTQGQLLTFNLISASLSAFS